MARRERRLIFTLGDSLGAAERGWPALLRERLAAAWPEMEVVLWNESLSGRAIGVQKFGPESNAMDVAVEAMRRAEEETGLPISEAIVCLGTNDAQTMWAERGMTVADIAGNARALAEAMLAELGAGGRLTVASPPAMGTLMAADAPCAEDLEGSSGQSKWRGGKERLAALAPKLRRVAAEVGACYAAVHEATTERVEEYVGGDGVHLTDAGQAAVAEAIAQAVLEGQLAGDLVKS